MQLHNKDCMAVLKDIPDESIDLIVTDPPYKVTSYGCAGNAGGMIARKAMMSGKVFTHNDIDCEQYAPEFHKGTKRRLSLLYIEIDQQYYNIAKERIKG